MFIRYEEIRLRKQRHKIARFDLATFSMIDREFSPISVYELGLSGDFRDFRRLVDYTRLGRVGDRRWHVEYGPRQGLDHLSHDNNTDEKGLNPLSLAFHSRDIPRIPCCDRLVIHSFIETRKRIIKLL
jgi:hypothetical protein